MNSDFGVNSFFQYLKSAVINEEGILLAACVTTCYALARSSFKFGLVKHSESRFSTTNLYHLFFFQLIIAGFKFISNQKID